jgi:hypothetical protein
MHTYRILTISPTGVRRTLLGMFKNDWQAIDSALSHFADARRVFVRRIK